MNTEVQTIKTDLEDLISRSDTELKHSNILHRNNQVASFGFGFAALIFGVGGGFALESWEAGVGIGGGLGAVAAAFGFLGRLSDHAKRAQTVGAVKRGAKRCRRDLESGAITSAEARSRVDDLDEQLGGPSRSDNRLRYRDGRGNACASS